MIALDVGVDVLICLNPIVPYNASIMHAPGKLSEGGLRLKHSVLQDTSLALVKNSPLSKKDRYAVASLNTVLGSLERDLKLAAD